MVLYTQSTTEVILGPRRWLNDNAETTNTKTNKHTAQNRLNCETTSSKTSQKSYHLVQNERTHICMLQKNKLPDDKHKTHLRNETHNDDEEESRRTTNRKKKIPIIRNTTLADGRWWRKNQSGHAQREREGKRERSWPTARQTTTTTTTILLLPGRAPAEPKKG